MSEEAIRRALEAIRDPATGKGLGTAGRIGAVRLSDGKAMVVIEAPAGAPGYDAARQEAEAAVKAVAGIETASVVLTADRPVPDLGLKPKAAAPQGPVAIPGIRRVIAVASGKGGVGKSTLAANLAVALAADGLKVGLLDADIYGPSQPRMLGVSGRPSSPDGKTILPLRNHGVTMMSLGLMVPEGEAVVWRGPMLMGALQQMLGQVQWGALDVLLVDLPPGTGDVQMTLCQKTEVAGAVIISTPQDIALIDARKGIDMFRKMNVPVLGLVENMGVFICDGCGKAHHPFGEGGAKAEAERLGVPFFGDVPLELGIREAGDGGAPAVISRPGSAGAKAFVAIAGKLREAVLA